MRTLTEAKPLSLPKEDDGALAPPLALGFANRRSYDKMNSSSDAFG
ncbi:MAG: hypothetical protein AAFR62_03655 [Cyanobacteria bacterium J06629_2]